MRFDRPRPLTVAQQYVSLSSNPACAGKGRLRGNALSWVFPATPTVLSRCYDARIEYQQGKSPEVFIDAPDLTLLAEGQPLPHVYAESPTRLCLYLPGSGQWNDWMRLDLTMVPWTALWLFYFEEWLCSGAWAGGGQHPSRRDRERSWKATSCTRTRRRSGPSLARA